LKTLDIHTRAACIFQGVAVLIALQKSSTKITFGGFARAIGLIRGDEGWQPWHRRQVSAILDAIAALEREDGGEPTLPYHRIVNAATGEPGQGALDHAAMIIKADRSTVAKKAATTRKARQALKDLSLPSA
jgi:hypothetical protein